MPFKSKGSKFTYITNSSVVVQFVCFVVNGYIGKKLSPVASNENWVFVFAFAYDESAYPMERNKILLNIFRSFYLEFQVKSFYCESFHTVYYRSRGWSTNEIGKKTFAQRNVAFDAMKTGIPAIPYAEFGKIFFSRNEMKNGGVRPIGIETMCSNHFEVNFYS